MHPRAIHLEALHVAVQFDPFEPFVKRCFQKATRTAFAGEYRCQTGNRFGFSYEINHVTVSPLDTVAAGNKRRSLSSKRFPSILAPREVDLKLDNEPTLPIVIGSPNPHRTAFRSGRRRSK
jgi:hypothetical protein